MAKLGAAELRFTPEEAAAFLRDVMGLILSRRCIGAGAPEVSLAITVSLCP
jgi:ATP/maltotriose-dependent transcriptional regulator MalT